MLVAIMDVPMHKATISVVEYATKLFCFRYSVLYINKSKTPKRVHVDPKKKWFGLNGGKITVLAVAISMISKKSVENISHNQPSKL